MTTLARTGPTLPRNSCTLAHCAGESAQSFAWAAARLHGQFAGEPDDGHRAQVLARAALTLVSSRLCRKLKQHGWFYVEDVCELGDRRDAGAVDSSLEGTDIGPIDTGFVGQRFLRKPLLLPELPQVAREDLTYFHPREASPLKGISPRSILDKRRERRAGSPTGPVLACPPGLMLLSVKGSALPVLGLADEPRCRTLSRSRGSAHALEVAPTRRGCASIDA